MRSISKKKVGTLIFPSSLLSLAWFFFTVIPLVILFPVPINPIGILYILINVIFFSLGALPFNWKHAFVLNEQKTYAETSFFETRFLKFIFIFCVFGSIFSTLLILQSSGVGLESYVHDFRASSGKFANLRVEGKLDYGITGILNFFFTYMCPILGGLTFFKHKKPLLKIWAFIFSFLPVLFFMLAQSAKIVIFYSIGFYIAAFLVRKIYANSFTLFDKKIIKNTLIAIIVFIPLIILSISTRHQINDVNELSLTSMKAILGYALGQIYSFADYFAFYLGLDSTSKYIHDFNSYGRYTFTSIYSIFDNSKGFPPGTFVDYYNYNNFIMTNIYTIFRGLINDFGVFGTFFFIYASGLLIHFFYYQLLSKKLSFFSISFFIISIVFLEGTYLISIFMARFVYLILAALIFIFWCNHFYLKNKLK